MIISFNLMTLMFYSGVILLGEIRCSSLLGIKGLPVTACLELFLRFEQFLISLFDCFQVSCLLP